MTQDQQWLNQRRFSLKTLKDFGFGKKSIEDSIHFEIDELVEKFCSVSGDLLIGTDFNVPIINILWQMVADSRFTPEDKIGMDMLDKVSTIFTSGIKYEALPMAFFKIFGELTGYNKRAKANSGIFSYLNDVIHQHEKDLDENNPRDFIDVYLLEIRKQVDDSKYNVKDLIGCIYDFFVAGTETSSTTLKWIVLYLTLHEDVQDRFDFF